MSDRARLDELLVARGLAPDIDTARRMVIAGQVRLGDEIPVKPSRLVARERDLQIETGEPYVSRGGRKLAAALEAFGIPVQDAVCADVGASTGGFTDCLLKNGAARVYAIDVGRGQLHWRLRQDERVIVMERTNARYVERLAEPVGLVTVDVAFISLRTLLPVVKNWLEEGGDLVALIKPQFEARAEDVEAGGVVRSSDARTEVVREVIAAAAECGLDPQGLLRSPLQGPKGNIEYLLWAREGGASRSERELLDEISI
ncbi:MAG: TlyA family RNA methyltransferase [Anaerolineales bacterium]|nr:TlyA family RNA methyltransferase [Anaerolineales bacterium]